MLLTDSSLTLLFLSLAVCTLSSLVSASVRHEFRRDVPIGWVPIRRAPSTSSLPLRVGLLQANLNQIENLLLDVSHPESPNYGQHWSPEQVASHFRPSNESIDVVRQWLSAEGIQLSRTRLSPTGWIEVNVTVHEAEFLLKTKYYLYEHSETGTTHMACGNTYHLPEYVSKHVDFITPTLHFDVKLKQDRVRKRDHGAKPGIGKSIGQPGAGVVTPKTTGSIKHILDELSNCDQTITPNCLRALYDFLYVPIATSRNSYGIVEYTPQAYVPEDLDLFFTNFSKSQVGQRPELVGIDGGFVQSTNTGFGFNGESNLDLMYGMTLVGKRQNVTLYQVGDDVEGASFNNFLDALDASFCTFEGGNDPNQDGIYPDPFGGYQGPEDCGKVTKPANVISTSYGYNEADLTPAYTARQCAEYAKLGLMGVTILYSSGDDGVAGNGGVCLDLDGNPSSGGNMFNPSFPGGCPFITSVGATQINAGAKVTDPESACQRVIFSGGGFSNHFALPDYQKDAVHSYLMNFPPPYAPDIWNSTGSSRAFPDVSANGANYVIAVDGEFSLVFGTSASSPVVGSILTAVNDARLAIGKKPIGFINPAIYSSRFKNAFNDIISGTNPGCGTVGFNATKGWDPVTGLGTPNFPKLLTAFLSLP